MRRSHGGLSIAAVLILVVVAWQCYVWIDHVPTYVLPSPDVTIRAVGSNLTLLLHRSERTLEGAVLGLAASVSLAVVLALGVVRWPVAEHVILTYALLIRTLPIVGVAPIVTLLTGRGLATSVLCVMVITVFSLLISTIQGFESVAPEITELSRLYTTPFLRRARIALIPAATASLLQGLRVAAPLAVVGALLAEWLDGFAGVGSLMITASADQEVQLLMAATLVAVLLSLLAYALVEVATTVAGQRGYQIDQITLGAGR
jgi:ABC-type nitrate/sulfonate/bicarbonate transport system permease component